MPLHPVLLDFTWAETHGTFSITHMPVFINSSPSFHSQPFETCSLKVCNFELVQLVLYVPGLFYPLRRTITACWTACASPMVTSTHVTLASTVWEELTSGSGLTAVSLGSFSLNFRYINY